MASKARDLSRRGHRAMAAAMTEDNITKTHVGLGNVANIDLSNVTNESKATMFTNPTFTGTAALPSGTTLDGGTMQYASCTTAALQLRLYQFGCPRFGGTRSEQVVEMYVYTFSE